MIKSFVDQDRRLALRVREFAHDWVFGHGAETIGSNDRERETVVGVVPLPPERDDVDVRPDQILP